MKTTKMLLLAITLMMVMLFAAGCSKSEPTAKQESKKESVNIVIAAAPPTLDPHRSVAKVTAEVIMNVFETLVTFDKDYKIVPMLAERIDVSSDGKTITFPLRKNIKFHNNKELTAEDAIASLNRWKKYSPTGRSAMDGVEMSAPDKNTLVLKLPKPSPVLLYDLAYPTSQAAYILPKEMLDKAGDGILGEYIGTGPYKYVEWKKDQHIHLTKFDGYQSAAGEPSGMAGKKTASFKDLYFRFISDAASRVNGIKSGEYDIVQDLPLDQYEQLKKNKDVRIIISKPYNYTGMIFDMKEGLFTSAKARQAVLIALDFDRIMLAAVPHKDFFRVNPSLMPQEISAWYTDAGKANYNQKNTEKAKQLLAEAGYNGEPITIMTTKDYLHMYNSALEIQSQLEKIGIKVKLDIYDWPTLLGMRSKREKWDAFVSAFPVTLEPVQTLFLDSRNQHASGYASKEMDAFMNQIRYAPSQEEAYKAWVKAQELYWNDLPVIKLGDIFGSTSIKSTLKVDNIFGFNLFWTVKPAK